MAISCLDLKGDVFCVTLYGYRGFSRRGTHPVRAPSRAPCWIFFGTTKYALILYLFYLKRSNLP